MQKPVLLLLAFELLIVGGWVATYGQRNHGTRPSPRVETLLIGNADTKIMRTDLLKVTDREFSQRLLEELSHAVLEPRVGFNLSEYKLVFLSPGGEVSHAFAYFPAGKGGAIAEPLRVATDGESYTFSYVEAVRPQQVPKSIPVSPESARRLQHWLDAYERWIARSSRKDQ